MITEVENIILNKEYFELTPEELESVNELVQSADEYEEMKWFLASTNEALVNDKIEASPELKEKIMTHLNQDEGKRRFWLNGLVVFLWPEDKEFYRRPAFQMSLAALLLIGFLMIYNQNNIQPESNMAINDTVEEEKPLDGTKNLESGEEEFDVVEENVITGSELSEDEIESDKIEQPLGGVDGLSRGQGGPLDDEVAMDELDSPNKSITTVTDADGFYQSSTEGFAEKLEIDEEVDNTVSNANNNERTNTVYASDIVSEDQKNRDKDVRLAKEEKEKEGKKDRFKTKGDKKRKMYKRSANAPDDDFDALVETEEKTVTSNDAEPGSAEKLDENAVNQGMYNTVSTDGGYGNTATNDYLPLQQSVQQTSELRQLFTTFK